MLLGRARELEAIDGFLGDVRAGRGRGLLVTGEAGIGKTALLDAARERAGDLNVITAVGIEAEAGLRFAGLVEIANPLLGELGNLPAPQAGAIRAALAVAVHPAPTSSRLAACAGLLGLLRSAAQDGPLLVVIDDAHWLDASSREYVGYAARRLHGARVGMLDGRAGGAPAVARSPGNDQAAVARRRPRPCVVAPLPTCRWPSENVSFALLGRPFPVSVGVPSPRRNGRSERHRLSLHTRRFRLTRASSRTCRCPRCLRRDWQSEASTSCSRRRGSLAGSRWLRRTGRAPGASRTSGAPHETSARGAWAPSRSGEI